MREIYNLNVQSYYNAHVYATYQLAFTNYYLHVATSRQPFKSFYWDTEQN